MAQVMSQLCHRMMSVDVVSNVVRPPTERQQKIIKLIQINPFMSATQMSQVMGPVEIIEHYQDAV